MVIFNSYFDITRGYVNQPKKTIPAGTPCRVSQVPNQICFSFHAAKRLMWNNSSQKNVVGRKFKKKIVNSNPIVIFINVNSPYPWKKSSTIVGKIPSHML